MGLNNIFIAFLLVNILASCSRNDSSIPNDNVVTGENTFYLTVAGIQDNNNNNNGKGKVSSVKGLIKSEEEKFVVGGEGFEIEFSSSENITNEYLESKYVKGIKSKTAEVMSAGKGYRILFYEVNNADEVFYKSEGITTASSAFSTKLKANKTYTWYAYSYNTSTIPDLPADVNNPLVPSLTDAPLLFAKGEIFTGAYGSNSKHISITFKHKVSKVEAVVDSRLIFASSITLLNLQFKDLVLTTHNFALKSGNIIGGAINTVNISNSDNISFENIGPTGFETTVKKSSNAYYTSTAITSLKVNISDFSIIKYGTVPLVLITPLNAKSGTLNYSSALPITRRALINLVDGGTIDGATWAEGNLYYDEFAPDPFKYKFESPVLSGQTAACNHYWLWMSLKPRSITGGTLPTGSDVGDPCSKVYPAGAWRLPTSQDFSDLGPKSNRNTPLNGAVYFITQDGQRLNLHEAGWITPGNSNCSPSNTNDGHYWTSNEVSSSNARALEMDQSWGGGDTQPSISKRYGLSIRCMRTY